MQNGITPHERWFDDRWFAQIERSAFGGQPRVRPAPVSVAGQQLGDDQEPISHLLTPDELTLMLEVSRGHSPRDIAQTTGWDLKDVMRMMRELCGRLGLIGDVVWLMASLSYRLGVEHGRAHR